MENKIKAVFLDVDGTLLSFNTHKVPESTIEAIKQLQAKGIKVIVATGRPEFLLDSVRHIHFDAYLTLNGCYCFVGDTDVYKSSFKPEEIEKIIEWNKDNNLPFAFMHKDGWFISSVNDDVKHICEHLDVEVPPLAPIEKARDYDIFQCMGFFEEKKDKYMEEHVLTGCELPRWSHVFTDIIKKGNDKGVGMEKLLEHMGLGIENAMAFGDGGNDIEILKKAGIGVAMGNASQSVKDADDYVTTSVDDNGIANALKYFKLID